MASRLLSATGLMAFLILASSSEAQEATSQPSDTGSYQLATASWLGGAFHDEIIDVAINPAKEIILAGNTGGWVPNGLAPVDLGNGEAKADNSGALSLKSKKPHAFVMRLSPDGKNVLGFSRFAANMGVLRKLHLDAKGQIFALCNTTEVTVLPGAGKGTGTYLLRLDAEGAKIERGLFISKAIDFALDSDGACVVLADKKLFRYSTLTFAQRWFASCDVEGRSAPVSVAIAPTSGTAIVLGNTQTSMGSETFRTPYAFAFNREGKAIWYLWSPEPKKICSVKNGGNGLVAHTTAQGAFAANAGGSVYLLLQANGGNSVCLRDPHNLDKPLEEAVFESAFQKGPAYGFHGTSRSNVVFRVDSAKGLLERGTWLSAWLSEQHANPLTIHQIAGDAQSHQFLVGESGFGCPTKDPWFTCKLGGFKGGGFLAIFDKDFGLIQAGYFPGTILRCVASADNTVVIAGSTKHFEDREASMPARTFQPLQIPFGGGDRDAYFAILKRAKPTAASLGSNSSHLASP